MRIVVDLNRCLGYAQCVPLAPDVLQLCENGGSLVRSCLAKMQLSRIFCLIR